ESIIEDFESYITVKDFEVQFNSFCKSNRQRTLSTTKIKEMMKEKGIEQEKPYVEWWENDKPIKRQVRVWRGIKWK
ncbi:MAG TPA: hypothetical protein VMV95_02645, partial [Bacillota bacterium]|nr:hypothetical protein [Bacillota bacterium]